MVAYQELLRNVSMIVIKFMISFVIFIIGLILGKFTGNLIKKVLVELEFRKLFKKTFYEDPFIEKKIGNIVKYIIYLVAIWIALNQLGLFRASVFVVSGIALIILALFVLSAVKDVIPNFVSGVIIKKKGLLKKDMKINIRNMSSNISGTVVDVNLHETIIKDNDDVVFVPNSLLLRSIRK